MAHEDTNTPTNVDVVVYALGVLSGSHKIVHSEAIAAKCFELIPSSFSWRLPEYRKWPDKYIVKTALEDAKKRKHGRLVDGAYALDPSKDGWRLTPEGAQWLSENKAWIERSLNLKGSSVPKLEAERFTKKLKTDPSFKVFRDTNKIEGVTPYMFTDMLGCAPDASNDIIRQKFDRVMATARLVADPDLINFLQACQVAFADLLESA